MIIRSEHARSVIAMVSATLVVVASWTNVAHADEPAPPPEDGARLNGSAPTDVAGDPLDPLRERFRLGMDHYRAGRYESAIVTWEAIYRELGSEKGYRLAFNLARAYDARGDGLKAAENYDTYLRETSRRRESGEVLEPNIERQALEARDRLAAIVSVIGRIRVVAGDRPELVQVDTTPPRLGDFTAYVTPRTVHTVTFGAGKDAERRNVVVAEGAIVEVAPRDSANATKAPARARVEPSGDDLTVRRERPFSPTIVWVAGAVTLASLAIPAVTYAHALSIESDYNDAHDAGDVAEQRRLAPNYEDAKRTAYVSLAVPGVLAATSGALLAWYLLGTKEVRPAVVPNAALTTSGGSVGVTGTF